MIAKGYNGTVVFHGNAIEIQREGFLARTSVGKGSKLIPLSAISGIQWKPPGRLTNGYIEFTIPGGNESRSRAGSATRDAAGNENAVIVTRKQEGDFLALKQAIESALLTR